MQIGHTISIWAKPLGTHLVHMQRAEAAGRGLHLVYLWGVANDLHDVILSCISYGKEIGSY